MFQLNFLSYPKNYYESPRSKIQDDNDKIVNAGNIKYDRHNS